MHGCVIFFSHLFGKSVYPYPIGDGDKRAALEAILADSRERGIPCRISGMSEADKNDLEAWFPGRFQFRCDRDGFDYVYAIDDLADLRGRKYQKKRNHFNRFRDTYPHYTTEPLSNANIEQVKSLTDRWYAKKLQEDPQGDYHMERAAITKALNHFAALGMEGLVLRDGADVLAFTLGSPLTPDTFDVHFEKALPDAEGAYPVINCEFARYLRGKYPHLQFLNREDDLGIEGLRKAKLSYYPHHLVEKCWACLLEDGYDY